MAIKKLFLSHAHADEEVVICLRAALVTLFEPALEIFCTSFPDDRIPCGSGTELHERIFGELNECDMAILVVSPKSIASDWVTFETTAITKLMGRVLFGVTIGELEDDVKISSIYTSLDRHYEFGSDSDIYQKLRSIHESNDFGPELAKDFQRLKSLEPKYVRPRIIGKLQDSLSGFSVEHRAGAERNFDRVDLSKWKEDNQLYGEFPNLLNPHTLDSVIRWIEVYLDMASSCELDSRKLTAELSQLAERKTGADTFP